MRIKVYNMISPASHKPVSNQFCIITDDGSYFQSYDSVIVFSPDIGRVQLDRFFWDYSKTTAKYRNLFLKETSRVTAEKVRNGTYELADLN